MILKKIMPIAFIIVMAANAKSQNILPAQRVDMVLEATATNTNISVNDSVFSASTPVISKLVIVLQDTIHLSKIHVRFGTTDSNYNLLTKYFTFDVSGVLSDGTSYARVGNVVYLTLGTFVGLQNGFAEIKLEDAYARLTDPIVVSGN